MRRLPLPLPVVVFLLSLLGLAALVVATTGSHVRFAQGVELTGTEVSREVKAGQSAALTLHFAVSQPLDGSYKVFVHCESISGGVDAVRINRDADPAVPSTKWTAQALEHHVEIPFDKNVRTGRYDIYAGLFNPQTGDRLALVDPPTPDSRALVGWVDVVRGDADEDMRELSPRTLRFQGTWAPWSVWLGGAILAAGLAVFALVRRKPDGEAKDSGKAEKEEDEDAGQPR